MTTNRILLEGEPGRHDQRPDREEQLDHVRSGLEYPLTEERKTDQALDRAGEAMDSAHAAELRNSFQHLRINGDRVPLLRLGPLTFSPHPQ